MDLQSAFSAFDRFADLLIGLKEGPEGEARDDHGRWTDGGGAIGRMEPTERIANEQGKTITVNPTPNMLAVALKRGDYPSVRVLVVGHNIVVGHSYDFTHDDMVDHLTSEAHPMTLAAQAATEHLRNHWEVLASPDAPSGGTPSFRMATLPGQYITVQRLNSRTPPLNEFPDGLKRALGMSTARKSRFEEMFLKDGPEDEARDEAGRWTTGGGGMIATKMHEDGKTRLLHTGEELPDHIKALGAIPPGWVDVKVNPDPGGDVMVTGRDAKDRVVAIRSESINAQRAAEKFARVHSLIGEFDQIKAQNDALMTSDVLRVRENAHAADLVMKTGLRPGSNKDTKAEKQAYGATTLLGHHVVQAEDGSVHLAFTGKEGIDLRIPIEDKPLASNLVERAKSAGPEGRIFKGVSDETLLAHVDKLGRGGYVTKDFRTRLGTQTAANVMATMRTPSTPREYRSSVMSVARVVSAKLGNTPKMALQAYIHPAVFTAWAHAA